MSTKTTDPTQRDYYIGRAPADEHAMRADFASAYQLEHTYQSDPSEENETLHWDANAIDDRWTSHDAPEIRQRWDYLNDAVHDWSRAPDTMRRMHENIEFNQAKGFDMVEPDQWRSLQQARELTDNGQWQQASESDRAATASMNAFATAAATEQGHESGWER
jgi:hypothetical protein